MPNVAYMESHDFHEQDEKIQSLLESPVVILDDETRRFLKIKRQRMETLKRVEAVTGRKARVVHETEIEVKIVANDNGDVHAPANDNRVDLDVPANDVAVEVSIAANDNGLEKNVAAFVATAEKKDFMVEHTLDNYEWALYAWRHEGEHLHNGIFDVDLKGNMSAQQIASLKEIVGGEHGDITRVNLVEGFNDLITKRKWGDHQNSGYNDEEVPAAEKLEQICQKEIGESLVKAFDSGNIDYFYELLRRTCDIVRIKKFLAIAA